MANDAHELALGDVEHELFDDHLAAERLAEIPQLEELLFVSRRRHVGTRESCENATWLVAERRASAEDIKNSSTRLRTSLKAGSWFMARRSRGRSMST